MGTSSAYNAVLVGIDSDLRDLIKQYPHYFNFSDPAEGTIDVRDFGTTGVVAFARGCHFENMPVGKLSLAGQRVQVKKDAQSAMLAAIGDVVAKL